MTSWDNLDRDLLSQSERIWVAEATGRKRTFYLDQVRCCEAYLKKSQNFKATSSLRYFHQRTFESISELNPFDSEKLNGTSN